MDIMHEKAISKIRDNSPDGVLSYKDYRQLMAWCFHLCKEDSSKLLSELVELGLVQRGKHGFKVLGVNHE